MLLNTFGVDFKLNWALTVNEVIHSYGECVYQNTIFTPLLSYECYFVATISVSLPLQMLFQCRSDGQWQMESRHRGLAYEGKRNKFLGVDKYFRIGYHTWFCQDQSGLG